MVVVFPAPFGPRYPMTSPSGTSRFREISARVFPNVLERSSVRIAFAMPGPEDSPSG